MLTKQEVLGEYGEVEFLLKCTLSFKFFAENMLRTTSDGRTIKIPKFQERWVMLADAHPRLVLEAPTGFAKTEIMGAMYPLWRLFKERNLRILFVSKSLDQAKGNMLERTKIYIRENEILKDMLLPIGSKEDITNNKQELRTRNGHWLKVVPYSDHIRGFRADLIICDEVDSYEETNTYFEHVVSRILEGGHIVLTSTPVGPTRLIAVLKDKANSGQLRNYFFEKTQALVAKDGSKAYNISPENVTYEMMEECVSLWPAAYSTRTILDKWWEQDKWNWMKNNMAEVLGDAADAIFPLKYVMKSFDRTLDFTSEVDNNAEYFIGCDFAISEGPKADFDCFTVTMKKNDRYIVRHVEIWKGTDIPFKVERMVRLFNRYNETEFGCTLVVDSSNFGKECERQVLARGVPVVAQSFASAARKQLLTTLSQIIKSGSLVLPRHPHPSYKDNVDCVEYTTKLREQLSGFLRVRSTKTGVDGMDSTAPHDDVAISLALSIIEAVDHVVDEDSTPMYVN